MIEPEIIATGIDFIKTGTRGMEPTIEEIIRNATKEIQILAYVFTPSAIPIFELLEVAAEKGIKITIILNNLKAQKPIIIDKLSEMTKNFPEQFKIFDFVDKRKRQLHAKVIIADRNIALVGSANFTWGGMYTNYEVGIKVEGDIAWKLAALADSLLYSK